jgi:hypothetical protein
MDGPSGPEAPPRRRRLAGAIAGLLALLALAGALLGVAAPAGALSTTFHHGDDWQHLWAVLDRFQTAPPKVPVVYLLGGSAARECTTLDKSWSDQVSRLVGRRIRAVNFGAVSQSYLRDITIVDKMPRVPTVVLIGVNLGRYTSSPPASSSAATAIPHGSILTSYTQHRFTGGDVLGDAAKRAMVSKWRRERDPVFKQRYSYNYGQLDLLIAECQRLDLHPVLVNLPFNDAIVRPALDAPRARYAEGCRVLAAKYHIRYYDFVGKVGFASRDFVDLWHCAPSGRAKYQARLSRVIHTVLDDYGMGSG